MPAFARAFFCPSIQYTPMARRNAKRVQLLDEHPPQLLELHELELHELDDEQLDPKSLEPLPTDAPVDPPMRAAATIIGGGSINALACIAHAVPASAPAPNSAVAHSRSSGVLRSSRRSFRCAASVACPPTDKPPRPKPVMRRAITR